jgi:acyl-CoA synthetase (AMP-forming)/AMP-acid ligase II
MTHHSLTEHSRRDGWRDGSDLYYTSGTTGRPKGVMFSERNVAFAATTMRHAMQLTSQDRVLNTSSLFHVSAVTTWSMMSAGACQVFLPDFDPIGYLNVAQNERVTVIGMLVPSMLNAMVQVLDVSSYNLAPLRLMTYGGSPMPETLLRTTAETFGSGLLQIYGMTEVGCATLLLPEDHILTGPEPVVRRVRSAGRAVPGLEIRIVDDQDREVPGSEVGEVVLRGQNVMLGYWNQPDSTAEALRSARRLFWLVTSVLSLSSGVGSVPGRAAAYILPATWRRRSQIGRSQRFLGLALSIRTLGGATPPHDRTLVDRPADGWGIRRPTSRCRQAGLRR